MATWRAIIPGLALLLFCAAPSFIGGPKSVAAQPPPPLPRTFETVSHLVSGAWRETKVVRLGQEIRFELRIQKSGVNQSISGVELTLRQTTLGQDGNYHFGGVLTHTRMQRSTLPSGDFRFLAQLRLQDRRMVGKVFAEFHVRYGQGDFVPNLLLTVKPAVGNIPGGDPHTDTYWGLKMSVTLPRYSYPRDALVFATLRVQNMSRQDRTLQSGYCVKPPWIELLDARGHVLPRPSFDGDGPPCPGMISTIIHPGQAIVRHRYVVLAADRIRVAATIGQLQVHGVPAVLHLVGGAAPTITVKETGTDIGIQLHARRPVSGLLHYGFRVECSRSGQMIPVLGSHQWLSIDAARLAAARPSGCDPSAPWGYHALAGWVGQPVVHIDVVNTRPAPCDRGTPGRQPTLPDVPQQTLTAIGISLLPPAALATMCQASAIYQIRFPFASSVPPQAVLAQVTSSSDPLINGHLAWAVLTHSPDPNHPQNPPVLYLSFVDARSGSPLDTVYAGGLHPPGPPIHLHTVPATGGEWIVLSGTRETPPISEKQAQQVMAAAPGGQGTIREVVLARVYNPNTPPLRDHLCWIFSVIPPGDDAIIRQGGYWVIYIDTETGAMLVAGGTARPGDLPVASSDGATS